MQHVGATLLHTACCVRLATMLHNVAFVWPTLLNMLQHDPTMLRATCWIRLAWALEVARGGGKGMGQRYHVRCNEVTWGISRFPRWPLITRGKSFIIFPGFIPSWRAFAFSSEVPGVSRTTPERLSFCYPVCTIDVNKKTMKMFAGSHTEIPLVFTSSCMLSCLHSGAMRVLATGIHMQELVEMFSLFANDRQTSPGWKYEKKNIWELIQLKRILQHGGTGVWRLIGVKIRTLKFSAISISSLHAAHQNTAWMANSYHWVANALLWMATVCSMAKCRLNGEIGHALRLNGEFYRPGVTHTKTPKIHCATISGSMADREWLLFQLTSDNHCLICQGG